MQKAQDIEESKPMAIELLTPFAKVELEAEIKDKNANKLVFWVEISIRSTMPIWSLRIKCANN